MIILTGGAGFIGSNFLKLLNDKGINDIIVVDNLAKSTKWKNLVGKRFLKYIHKNEFLTQLPNLVDSNNIEGIFHFGACSATTELDMDYLFQNNFEYSKKIAQIALKFNIPFIYASSAATYGNGDEGYDDNVFFPLKPLNGYGFSKHLFDIWLIERGLEYEFTGLKFFNVFGPNEYHKGDMASMVFKSFNQVCQNNEIKLFKSYNSNFPDGGQVRDFVYVKDANQIVWDLFENKIKGIYNIGTGVSRTWNDLANAVFASLNKIANIKYIDMPDSLKNQYQYFTQANINKLVSSGVNPAFMTLEQSIDDYIVNHLSRPYQYV